MSKIFKFLATLGPLGYAPAPGTLATLVTAPVVWAMAAFGADEYVLASVLALVLSFWIINRALSACEPQHHDPAEIVLDEVAGFICIFNLIPITILSIVLAFILFRLFDIVKPFGIKTCENLVGAVGIMADDLLAALYAGGILAFCVLLLERF